MATALTPGYIYFVESDGTDNDDWITDHAGDPDDLDLANMTEGTEHCKIQIPRGFTRSSITGITPSVMSGGLGWELRQEYRFQKALINGIQTSLANANLIEQFFMSDRHTSGATATYKEYYMIVYFGLNSNNLCMKFIDHGGNLKSYCKGVATSVSTTWSDAENLLFNVRIQWQSVWN